MSGFLIGGYWGPRKESIERCADRLLSFFSVLTACDPLFESWFEKGMSRKKAFEQKANVLDRTYLLKRLDRGRNRRDVGRTVIEELGFSVSWWNGRKETEAVGLSVACGLYSSGMSNCVTIDLPEHLGTLRSSDRMTDVLLGLAKAWEPEWAGVMSRDSMRQREYDAGRPFVDWMVFVPGKVGTVPPPGRLISTEVGSVIVVKPDPPNVHDFQDLKLVQRVEALLIS